MLDAQAEVQAGIQHEGEEPPRATDEENRAIVAWNYLSNGSGGIDWSGLPLVVALLGIDDVEALMHRLLVIKTHKPPKD